MGVEPAAINAVTTTIGPYVHIQGCFYHLTQNTWRKIQSMGVVPCTVPVKTRDISALCGSPCPSANGLCA
ncbi:hypothetical protein LSH36_37g13001 [Paralvinella palmiformis]|uniref:Uncharacterized protein n=1 Tax=Paralvinella palmiformis TaxID=53620 RepID=A0AAD9NDV8_9ANNE|nr:hypothetical protein LSH36_37g13001 [Paralvinella palmiformis]